MVTQRLSFIYYAGHPASLAFYPPSCAMCNSGGQPSTMVYMNLQPPEDTADVSPRRWWSLKPPSHPYSLGVQTDVRTKNNGGGYFLLPLPAVTDSFCFRKWSVLCCPDFPLAMAVPTWAYHCQRQTAALLSACKINKKFRLNSHVGQKFIQLTLKVYKYTLFLWHIRKFACNFAAPNNL